MVTFRTPSYSFYIGLVCVGAGMAAIGARPHDCWLGLTLAPILLVAGYLVLMPFGLFPRRTAAYAVHRSALPSETKFAGPIAGATTFVVALVVYLTTLWPSPGWWDSGGYIAAGYTMGITNAPGSLILILVGKVFSMFAWSDNPAVRFNIVTAGVVSFAGALIAATVTRIVRSLAEPDMVVVIGSGVAAGLTLAFAPTIWLHATFTNPYAYSLASGAVLIYLAFRWWENPSAQGAGNFLLLAAFVLGLDLSVHRSNLILAPAFLALILIRKPSSLKSFTLWGGGVALFVLGFSLQLAHMFRAGADPLINMGNPETLAALRDYLSLKQTGVNVFGTDLLTRKGPFWSYQVTDMYLRYLGWNFVGADLATGRVAVWTTALVPALLLVAGAMFHFVRKFRQALFLAIAFVIVCGLAIVYLNVPENYFREMDRHFVTTFALVAVWAGLGCFAISTLLRKVMPGALSVRRTLVVMLVIAAPVLQVRANYADCDQSGNYRVEGYARNILNSCEDSAILITRGDNDTFPLWYYQMVEGVRTDVTVLNVSLLNTPWYLNTINQHVSDMPWSLTSEMIDALTPIRWDSAQTVCVPGEGNAEDSLALKVPPTFARILLVQDQALLDMVRVNRWQRPIYFTSGFGNQLPLGLIDHARMDGLVFRILPDTVTVSDSRTLRTNVVDRFDFSGYGATSFYDPAGENQARMYFMPIGMLMQDMTARGDTAGVENIRALVTEHFPTMAARMFPPES